MKKLKSLLAVVLAAAMLLSMTACGGGDEKSADPNAGVYKAATAEMWGMEMAIEDIWSGGFEIELKDKGKCQIRIDGEKANGKWELSGSSFHVEGGGVDCSGTLKDGVMTLENVLDMGVNLTFHKEGYRPSASAPEAEPGEAPSAAPAAPAEPAAPAGPSAIQQQWNGTWYGVMYVGEATGDFSGIPSDFYDIYTVVDVDESGKGTLDVFLAGVEDAFASMSCQAEDYGIDAIEGTIAGGVEIVPSNWMFRQSPDWPGKYVIMDTIEDGDSLFEYYIFIRQWGDSWQADVDTDFEMVPPSWADYEEAIANGEAPPVGFAPFAYGGSGMSSGGAADGESASGGESAATGGTAPGFSGPTATYDYGENGEIFFDYPDSYSFERKFGVDTLKSADGSIKITFVADWGMDDYALRMEGYEKYVAESNGVIEDGLSYAGYEAVRVTWENVLGDVTQETYILFGQGAGQYVGVNVAVTGSGIDSNSADIEAILHSVRLK